MISSYCHQIDHSSSSINQHAVSPFQFIPRKYSINQHEPFLTWRRIKINKAYKSYGFGSSVQPARQECSNWPGNSAWERQLASERYGQPVLLVALLEIGGPWGYLAMHFAVLFNKAAAREACEFFGAQFGLHLAPPLYLGFCMWVCFLKMYVQKIIYHFPSFVPGDVLSSTWVPVPPLFLHSKYAYTYWVTV
jgi:hypothetical protein